MSDDETEKKATLTDIIMANVRGWNSYWPWIKDKPVAERGAVREILTSAGIAFERLVSLPQGKDPPDCEAIIDGQLVGIEVTELVHEPTLRRSLKALKERARGRKPEKAEAYCVWDRATLHDALQTLIDGKEDRIEKKERAGTGGGYSRYFLIIPTDEFFLGAESVKEWLTGKTFRASRITDVLLGLSYHPSHQCCPVFQLRLGGAS